MTTLDDLLHKYATEGEKIESNGTSAGYYTWAGVLSTFLREAMPIIIAEARKDLVPTAAVEPVETLDEAAERIAQDFPDKKIQAIKELRTWAIDHEPHNSSLKPCKEAMDRAFEKLGYNWTWLLRRAWQASDTGVGGYTIKYQAETNSATLRVRATKDWQCECPAFQHRAFDYLLCKHIVRAKDKVERERT